MTPKQKSAMEYALATLCAAVTPKHGMAVYVNWAPIDCATMHQTAIDLLRAELDLPPITEPALVRELDLFAKTIERVQK